MNRKKHFLLMLFCVLLVIGSVRYMIARRDADRKKMVTVVLSKQWDTDSAGVMDGIRDYAMYHEIVLNVWYKNELSSKELEELVLEEQKDHTRGVLLVYPELYMEQGLGGTYGGEQVIAATDKMKEQFSRTVGFEECDEFAHSLPLADEALKQLTEEGQFIFIKNTYKLGYLSMEMLVQRGQEGNMEDIRMEYLRVDEKTITEGEIHSLLTE